MKKTIFILILTILVCLVFKLFHLIGTQAIIDLSAVLVGIIYLVIGFGFFRRKEHRLLNSSLGLVLVIASSFAILPLLFFFLNSITFVININYNDILFNYYKNALNSLIGLALFLAVCITDLIRGHQALPDAEGKRTQKILTAMAGILLIVVSVAIARNLGQHIAYSRILTKLTLLSILLMALPYLFFTRKPANGLSAVSLLIAFLILVNNIPPNYLFSPDFSGTQWYSYTKPVRESTGKGLDTLKTINSLKKEGNNFYSITFSGDYSSILEANNKKCMEESIRMRRNCSLFTSFADSAHYLFARNFDNPQGWKCKSLVCRTHPSDGYASLSLVRLADLGFDVSEDLENLSYARKKELVNVVFYTPDGINEKGVVVALASVDAQRIREDTGKAFINCTYLIREILDHAKNIEEAISIIKKYNIMNDVWSGSLDQHLLLADASGRSVVAEISEGEFRFIPNTANWQATTNSPSYNISTADQKKNCPRYDAISTAMEAAKGKMDLSQALDMLHKIGHQYTEWSTVYDISQKEMNVVIDFDFSKKYTFSVKDNKSIH
jgi:hypothetical protein